jgi:predicted alpha/beta-hydrolase family hydrolase
MTVQKRLAACAISLACLLPLSVVPAPAGSLPPSAAAAAVAPALLSDQDVPIRPRGHVYLFRGALGPIFSRGMDRLSERLEEAGMKADVYEFPICRLIAQKAMRDYRADPAPVILIGHSMGGLCALIFAEVLQDNNIPVSLVVTIDPAHASPKVPLNVERFINIFLSTSILGGGDIVAREGFRGHYASFDLSKHDEVTHINIDKMDSVHEQLVNAIVQLATTPTNGEALPLRYVVPPGSAVELWDSGIGLLARSGDTLESLAAAQNLPLWSLTQINHLPGNAPLADGQRVIVPRHLPALAVLSAQTPAER